MHVVTTAGFRHRSYLVQRCRQEFLSLRGYWKIALAEQQTKGTYCFPKLIYHFSREQDMSWTSDRPQTKKLTGFLSTLEKPRKINLS